MLFKHFYDEDLAQGSYLIGCQAKGEAIVVDAWRNLQTYLDEAERNNMKIVAVTETHIHADYLSGSRELAAMTGAKLYLSDEGNADWKYGFDGIKLYDGDEIKLGNITVKAMHTPGHTPEHMSFLVTDGAAASGPGFYLTGDFVFVGDIGRPDLLDEAAGGIDTRFVGAKLLFASLRDKFLNLPDYVQVWPAHGAGSACGKALGAIPSSTVGYERNFSWWADYVKRGDEAGFTKALLDGQPDAPLYFGRMKMQNKAGPALLGERPALKTYTASELQAALDADNVIFVDTRNRDSYIKNYVEGSLFVPMGKSFITYASYAIDPLTDQRPIVVLAQDEASAEKMRTKMSYVGIDNVVGYISSLEGLRTSQVKMVSPADLANVKNSYILDVRTANEYTAGHIQGANQLHVGRVVYKQNSLPKDKNLVVHCQAGGRATVAASILRAAGFERVLELEGSYAGYESYLKNREVVNA
ncbi:MAG: MBL fold metallo-hydrolase [Deinococcales bacterium]